MKEKVGEEKTRKNVLSTFAHTCHRHQHIGCCPMKYVIFQKLRHIISIDGLRPHRSSNDVSNVVQGHLVDGGCGRLSSEEFVRWIANHRNRIRRRIAIDGVHNARTAATRIIRLAESNTLTCHARQRCTSREQKSRREQRLGKSCEKAKKENIMMKKCT